MQFVPKVKPVEAMQWWPGKVDEIRKWYAGFNGLGLPPVCDEIVQDVSFVCRIRIPGHEITLHPGDWIVFNGSGYGQVWGHRDFIAAFEAVSNKGWHPHQDILKDQVKKDPAKGQKERADFLKMAPNPGEGIQTRKGPCLDPDKMNGAADQVPTNSIYGPGGPGYYDDPRL